MTQHRNETQANAATPHGALGAVLVLGLALIPALVASFSGRAAAGTLSAQTCVTDAYTGVTIAPCPTSTSSSTTSTTTEATITLTVSFSGGELRWQACGFASSASGTTVDLYLNGELQAQSGGSSPVGSGGCTDPATFPLCPQSQTQFTAVAVDASTQQSSNSQVFTANPSGCVVVATNTGSGIAINGGVQAASPAGTGTVLTKASTGGLAFTGANILRYIAIAVIAIALGMAIVYINRLRHRRGQGVRR